MKFVILVSKNSKYKNHINKIYEECDFNTEIRFVEESKNLNGFLIYNLNNTNISIDILQSNNFINKDFLSMFLTKKDVQKKLNSNGILTPDIIETYTNQKVVLKENTHEGLIRYIDNNIELENAISEITNFYLEEYICDYDEEMKIYFVFDKIFNYIKEIEDEKLQKLIFKISEILKLQVFSVDILQKENKYYVIDVNQSPGFYKSDIARDYFIKKIKSKMDK